MSNIAARKEAHWRRLIRDQARSGLSIRAWCHTHGRKESAFYWWRTELARRVGVVPTGRRSDRVVAGERQALDRAASSQGHALVPVRVVEDKARSADGRIEIILPGGARVHMAGRVDRQMLVDVMAVLNGCDNADEDRAGSKAEGRPC